MCTSKNAKRLPTIQVLQNAVKLPNTNRFWLDAVKLNNCTRRFVKNRRDTRTAVHPVTRAFTSQELLRSRLSGKKIVFVQVCLPSVRCSARRLFHTADLIIYLHSYGVSRARANRWIRSFKRFSTVHTHLLRFNIFEKLRRLERVGRNTCERNENCSWLCDNGRLWKPFSDRNVWSILITPSAHNMKFFSKLNGSFKLNGPIADNCSVSEGLLNI